VKYVILIYSNPSARSAWNSLPAEQRAVGVAAYASLNAELTAAGEYIASASLVDASQTTHVRVEDGKPIPTDGPFAEVKEHLAGFYLVDCDSRERALEIAAQIPEAAAGGVLEVRPVQELDDLAT
jgi:hypothetical protein